ncbi:MAG: hypothetical protein AB9834_13820 [Lentimicrobium sp.]
MTNKETVERNIGLTMDFVNHLIDNPVVANNLPDFFRLEFAEKDFPRIEHKQETGSGANVVRKIVRVRNNFELA